MSHLNSEWTILEKLLLTQAVYKYGENMWFQVARVLKQHGLIQQQELHRQSDFYSQKVQTNKKKKKKKTSHMSDINDLPCRIARSNTIY
jgi:hypothetical protein